MKGGVYLHIYLPEARPDEEDTELTELLKELRRLPVVTTLTYTKDVQRPMLEVVSIFEGKEEIRESLDALKERL